MLETEPRDYDIQVSPLPLCLVVPLSVDCLNHWKRQMHARPFCSQHCWAQMRYRVDVYLKKSEVLLRRKRPCSQPVTELCSLSGLRLQTGRRHREGLWREGDIYNSCVSLQTQQLIPDVSCGSDLESVVQVAAVPGGEEPCLLCQSYQEKVLKTKKCCDPDLADFDLISLKGSQQIYIFKVNQLPS